MHIPRPLADVFGRSHVVSFPQGHVRLHAHAFKMRGFPRVRVFTAASGDPTRATVIAVMHGVRRNADAYRDAWVPLIAGRDAIVVAPLFSGERFPDTHSYNLGGTIDPTFTRHRPRRKWTFAMVAPLVEDAVKRLGGTPGTFRMYGHSAGAQFVHRYLAFTPDAPVDRAVAANAGWYTMPRRRRPFPYGFERAPKTDLTAFLARDLVVMLGGADHGQEFRRDDEHTLRQGSTRFERGRAFYESGRELAGKLDADFGWRLVVVPGVAHEHARMAVTAAEYLLD